MVVFPLQPSGRTVCGRGGCGGPEWRVHARSSWLPMLRGGRRWAGYPPWSQHLTRRTAADWQGEERGRLGQGKTSYIGLNKSSRGVPIQLSLVLCQQVTSYGNLCERIFNTAKCIHLLSMIVLYAYFHVSVTWSISSKLKQQFFNNHLFNQSIPWHSS